MMRLVVIVKREPTAAGPRRRGIGRDELSVPEDPAGSRQNAEYGANFADHSDPIWCSSRQPKGVLCRLFNEHAAF